uniref:Uncharacterized protein n=1 Tax=Populus alba TaxID=43335 RepID=A0A4V6ABX9_POPAL|nr:hypothetical protein D5086_0000040500 [Populus alba]
MCILALHLDSITFEVRSTFEKAFDLASEYRQLQLHVQLQEITTDDKSLSQFLQLDQISYSQCGHINHLIPTPADWWWFFFSFPFIRKLHRRRFHVRREVKSSSEWVGLTRRRGPARYVAGITMLQIAVVSIINLLYLRDSETAISCLCGHFVILSNSRALRFHSIEFFDPLDAVSPLQIY